MLVMWIEPVLVSHDMFVVLQSKLVVPIQDSVDTLHNLEALIREELQLDELGSSGDRRIRGGSLYDIHIQQRNSLGAVYRL